MVEVQSTAPATHPLGTAELLDLFSRDVAVGGVLGSVADSGHERQGADAEGRIGVDRGALRLGCPEVPGWGRLGVSYGPFPASPGWATVVTLLNGHHGSQTRKAYSGRWRNRLRSRFTGVVRRALVSGPWRGHVHRLGRVAPSSAHDLTVPAYRVNLRVGWSRSAERPTGTRHLPGMSVVAAGVRNGDLRAVVAGRELTVVPGVMNTPLCLTLLECEHGTGYLVGGLDGAHGTGALPHLAPVAYDPRRREAGAYVGVHQSVLGEVGFSGDTRVYGVARAAWGSACPCRPPEESAGAVGCITAELDGTTATTWLRFRSAGPQDHWELRLDRRSVEIGVRVAGEWRSVRSGRRPRGPGQLMVQDTGSSVLVAVDGRSLLGGRIDDGSLADHGGVVAGPGWQRVLTRPRTVDLPSHLRPTPLWQPDSRPSFHDPLTGAGPLDGRVHDGVEWWRLHGEGRLVLSDREAKVDATPDRHNAGRTLYAVPWTGAPVELSVTLVPPPRSGPGEHRGRAGVFFRSKTGDQLVVATYLDDWYVGRSLSSFAHVAGEEHFFRAVWTNLGERVGWEHPYRLRVRFDGDRYLASINGEPVLFRRVSDMVPGAPRISPDWVGLAVNEEFGNDSGSAFRDLELGPLDDG